MRWEERPGGKLFPGGKPPVLDPKQMPAAGPGSVLLGLSCMGTTGSLLLWGLQMQAAPISWVPRGCFKMSPSAGRAPAPCPPHQSCQGQHGDVIQPTPAHLRPPPQGPLRTELPPCARGQVTRLFSLICTLKSRPARAR